MTQGFTSDFGKLEPCVELNVTEGDVHFRGRHCTATISLPVPAEELPVKPMVAVKLNLSSVKLGSTVYQYYADRIEFFTREAFSFGTCFPSTCSRDDIELMVRSYGDKSNLKVGLRKYCDSYDDRYNIKWTPILFVVTAVTVIILGLVSTATWAFVFREWYGVPLPKTEFFSHFNAIKHMEKLFRPVTVDDRMRPMESLVVVASIAGNCAHVLQAGTLFSTQFRECFDISI